MMNQLRRAIRNWLARDDYPQKTLNKMQACSPEPDHFRTPCINFSVRSAQGGFVIETSHYDRHTDRHASQLYVLTDYDTLGEELSKILSIESLRK